MRIIQDKDIWIHDNWIHIDGVGQIALYSPSEKAILLDYSMKWIIDSNERIYCANDQQEIKTKIKHLFNGI